MAESKTTKAAAEEAPALAPREPDRVAMVSLRADGTPDQTPGYEVITDEPDPRLTEKTEG